MDKLEFYNFREKIHRKLVCENIISATDTIKIKKIHKRYESSGIIYHYILSIKGLKNKYFLRTVKEKDYSFMVVDHLNELNKKYSHLNFPSALIPPFKINNHMYILTSYINGISLDMKMAVMTNKQLLSLSGVLNEKINCLHTVTSTKYSQGYNASNLQFADIMYNKIVTKLQSEECLQQFLYNLEVDSIKEKIWNILKNSKYSIPTLIHLDIKPANIIVSEQNEVYLIDFELARFSDIDYEWTNLLIKTILHYSKRFKKYVLLPIIEKNFVSFEEALHYDKYKIYMLYHSINNFIYYIKHKRHCPKEVKKLIVKILKELN